MTKRPLILLLIILFASSCKEQLNYKHTASAEILPCDLENGELIKEALYEFENYIVKNYPYKDLQNINLGYTNYWHVATSSTPPKTDSLSEHTKTVLNTLIQRHILQKNINGKIALNTKIDAVSCIAKNIDDEGLKTTFNALLSANSLRPELFIPAINRRSNLFVKDKALATYIALELFYGKLANIDLTLTDNERFSTFRNTMNHNSHEGHNH